MLEIDGIQLLTSDEVAVLLCVSRRTLRRWVAEGRVPKPREHGQIRLWPRAELEGWIAKQFGPSSGSLSEGERRA